jgi:hypothetical protein
MAVTSYEAITGILSLVIPALTLVAYSIIRRRSADTAEELLPAYLREPEAIGQFRFMRRFGLSAYETGIGEPEEVRFEQARAALRVFSILPANRKIRAIEFLLSNKLASDFGKEPEVDRETLAFLLLAASSIRTQSMFMDYLRMLSMGDTSGKEADSK